MPTDLVSLIGALQACGLGQLAVSAPTLTVGALPEGTFLGGNASDAVIYMHTHLDTHLHA